MWRILTERMRKLATMQSHQRLIIPIAAAFVFIVAGLLLVRGFGGTMAAAPSSSVAHAPTVEQVSNEILETAKGLGITQQQAVDQLQVVQDQLATQQTETKKLSEQIATLTEKLDVLQQSVASVPAPSVAATVAATVQLPKAQPSKK
jgi:septal ring factor EnvC (AmiA/AmiB activator)